MLHIWRNTSIGKDSIKEVKRERPRKYKKREWNSERIEYVIENYYKMTRKELAEALGTTVYDIANIVSKIRKNGGLKERKKRDLTDEEIAFIEENIGTMNINQIAEELGRQYGVISRYIEQAEADGVIPRMTRRNEKIEEELDYVLKNYYEKTFSEMARDLGVDIHIIEGRVRTLRNKGLLTKRKAQKLSKDKIQYIKENRNKMTALEISEEIGVSRATVYKYIREAEGR